MSTEASQPRLCRSQLREEAFEWVGNEVVFSDILEVKRADGTGVRGCFALRHRTRQVLLIAFDNHMRADLVTDATPTMACEVPGGMWQSEEAHTLWGGPDPLLALAQRRMSLSMSRAGMPTDIGMWNSLSASSSWLELHVAPILRWGRYFASGSDAGSTCIIKSDPHAGLDNLSPRALCEADMSWRIFLHSPYGDVYFSRDGTILK
jgi:transposase InsO family protein